MHLKGAIIVGCLAIMGGATIFAMLQPLGPDPRQTSGWKRYWYPIETNSYARLFSVSCANDYACRLNNIFVNGSSNRQEVWAVGNVGLLLHKIGHGPWQRIEIKAMSVQDVNPPSRNKPRVSKFRQQFPGVATPTFIGLTLNQAQKVASASGLRLSTTFAPGKKGTIVRQFQEPDTRVASKSTIDVVVGDSPGSSALGPGGIPRSQDTPPHGSAGVGSTNQDRRPPSDSGAFVPINDDFLAIDCNELDCHILGKRGLIYTGSKDGSTPWTFRKLTFLGPIERLLEASSTTLVFGEGPGGNIVVLYRTAEDNTFAPNTPPVKIYGFSQDHQIVWGSASNGQKIYGFTSELGAEFSVGSSGLIQRIDGVGSRRSYRQLSGGTASSLYCIRFFGVGSQNGWIVGDHGIVLNSYDGGDTWIHETQGAEGGAPNRRLPAPWYWSLAGFMIMFCLLVVISPEPPVVTDISVADRAVSDAPLKSGDRDVLDFMPAVLGLSRFIRNPKTQPPLTLAIEGKWGEGKSSLMSLLCSDLKKSRFRPVWFNAWHHQNEEQLLAALLEHICNQGLPPWWHLDNWIFRTRLLSIRFGQMWPMMLVVILALLGSAAYEYAHVQQDPKHGLGQSLVSTIAYAKAGWSNFWTSVSESSKEHQRKEDVKSGSVARKDTTTSSNSETVAASPPLGSVVGSNDENKIDLGAYGFAASLVGLLIAVLKKFKAFGVSSTKLSDNLKAAVTVKDLKPEPGIRRQFQREFNDVCRAWSWGARRLIIFIDDLDRCRPDSVVTVLESVNFLTTAGECIVVMGIAPETVIHCIGLSFKDIAEAHALYSGRGISDQEKAQARFEHGERYIRKLVNISIPLPKTTEDQRKKILKNKAAVASEKEPAARWRLQLWELLSGVGRLTLKLAPALLIVGLAILVSVVGYRIGIPFEELPDRASLRMPDAKAEPVSTMSQVDNQKPSILVNTKTLTVTRPTEQTANLVAPGGDHVSGIWWSDLCDAFIFVVLSGFLFYVLTSRSNQDAENSADFEDSLAIWDQFIVTICETPRELKRILNDLRYQAMMRRNEGPSSTRAERLIKRVRQLVTGAREQDPFLTRLDEADLPPIKVAELLSISANECERFLDPKELNVYPADSESFKQLMKSKNTHIERFGRWIKPTRSRRAAAAAGD